MYRAEGNTRVAFYNVKNFKYHTWQYGAEMLCDDAHTHSHIHSIQQPGNQHRIAVSYNMVAGRHRWAERTRDELNVLKWVANIGCRTTSDRWQLLPSYYHLSFLMHGNNISRTNEYTVCGSCDGCDRILTLCIGGHLALESAVQLKRFSQCGYMS